MKSFIKVILILIIVMSITNISLATSKIEAENFTPTYNTNIMPVKNLGQTILGYIRNIAVISSVVLIAVFGLKFMIGSTEQRAEYKKSFMPLIIGIFIVASSTTIISWVWKLL